MLQVAFGQSKYFSDHLVENVKRGIRQKIRRGRMADARPLGYVNNYRCTKKGGKCGQPYISADALAAQAHTLLQSVSLPLEEIEVMEKQINAWESESISSREEVTQNLKSKLSETQAKLDRLVSLYLDGDIERDSYLTKKDALLRQKAKLEESLGDFRQQGRNRLEPLRSFVLSLKEAEKVAQTKNYAEWRNFFRSLGSTPEIKGQNAFNQLGRTLGFYGENKIAFCPAERGGVAARSSQFRQS